MLVTLGFGVSAFYATLKKIYHSHRHGDLTDSHAHMHIDQHRHKH